MSFLSTDNPADIMALTEAYPYFKELYSDMIKFQRKPKELVNMFSEALEIMDRNTVKYMIEDRDEKIRQLTSENNQLVDKLQQQDDRLQQQTRLIDELMKRLDNIEAKDR